jgi:hypothetical protein
VVEKTASILAFPLLEYDDRRIYCSDGKLGMPVLMFEKRVFRLDTPRGLDTLLGCKLLSPPIGTIVPAVFERRLVGKISSRKRG